MIRSTAIWYYEPRRVTKYLMNNLEPRRVTASIGGETMKTYPLYNARGKLIGYVASNASDATGEAGPKRRRRRRKGVMRAAKAIDTSAEPTKRRGRPRKTVAPQSE